MHVQPENRKSSGAHSVAGFHVGTSLEHYRGQKVYVKETNSERVGDTIFYKHKYLTMPTKTKADAVVKAAKDLKKALAGGIPQSNIDKEAIEKLMEIFKNNAEVAKNEDAERQRVQKRGDDSRWLCIDRIN